MNTTSARAGRARVTLETVIVRRFRGEWTVEVVRPDDWRAGTGLLCTLRG